MTNFPLLFIIFCILTQIIVWVKLAPTAKHNSENKGGWIMRILAILIVASVVFLGDKIALVIPFFNKVFWTHSLVSGIIADILVLAGVVFMICSRFTLGKNWSANVTFKQEHELITTGPYAYVRHPIYSGLLLIILGLAVYAGIFSGFFLFILFFFGAYYKGYKEEKLLMEHFGVKYLEYKKQVKALVPFIF